MESTPQLIGAQGPQYALTFVQRLLLAGRVPWFYAWKAIWPANLMFTYPHWKIDSGDRMQYLFPVGLAVLADSAGLACPRRTAGRWPAFLFFLGTLFPALGFLNVYPFRYSYVADHFQYLALLGNHRSRRCGADGSGAADFAGHACGNRLAALALAAF